MKRITLSIAIFLCGVTATPALADHDREDSYEHDYSNNDRNRNRDRDRGAFSPGPFDDSPVTIGPICMPNSTCNFESKPEDQR